MSERHSSAPAVAIRQADPPPHWLLADLKPFRPYRYKGIGFDIFNPDEEDDDGD
ncbi:MAG TPA: hypothetical protein VKS82_07290 [Streptosporangiaceae bacterium]|nr:hypothetical protein [Streptosporangiaceae bacterium]